jgi:phosphatidylinositol kinase/protein kinase (PI-3  family)
VESYDSLSSSSNARSFLLHIKLLYLTNCKMNEFVDLIETRGLTGSIDKSRETGFCKISRGSIDKSRETAGNIQFFDHYCRQVFVKFQETIFVCVSRFVNNLRIHH